MPEPAASDVVRALLRTRTALMADVDRDFAEAPRLLVRSDLTGTMQLYEHSGEELTQLTALPEPVATASYVPGTRQAVIAADAGGNERHQLYLLDLEAVRSAPAAEFDELTAITDEPRFGHQFAGISPEGRRLAYVSNRSNGVDFDLWMCELAGGEHRLLYAGGAYCFPGSGFSPDGRYVSVLRPGDRPLDLDLVLVDVDSGEAHLPLPHPHEAALIGAPAWVSPQRFYVSSNAGGDIAAVLRHDLGTGRTEVVAGTGERYDADVVTSRDGGTVLVTENRDGATVISRLDTERVALGPAIDLPQPGVAHSYFFAPPALSADGRRVYYTLSSPRLAGDVFVADLATGETRRLTRSPAEVDPAQLAVPELGEVESFDGVRVPYFVYRPPSRDTPPPAVVLIHGGPEAQSVLQFNPVLQALVACGYGVVVPNVRGSTGYGKRYASLDDTTRRLDSVRDLAAVHGALETIGFDPGRASLWGGSYGGYMVLAGLAFQPELWAAGVDIVGISNLVTFLQNTADYRRAVREREYGSLERDRDFLIEASPLTHADAIRAALFVIHGRNDPRVPVGEAEQLAENLGRRGVPCTLLIYEDEGHGLVRLENRLDAYPRAIEFLSRAAVGRPPSGEAR